jgi:hypothetical protein
MRNIVFMNIILLAVGNVATAQHNHDHRTGRQPGLERWDEITFSFGGRSHIETLANALWHNVNAVCWDAYSKYRHEPNWDATYQEMRQMLDAAGHIRELVHEQQYHHAHHEEDHIAKDLHDLDRLFHHLEDDVRHWSVHYGGHTAHSGHYQRPARDPYRNHGSLRSRKARLEATLHHLMEDYGVQSQFTDENSQGVPIAPPPR